MYDLGLQCWATEVMGCHPIHPKTLKLLCLVDNNLCQKAHYQKLGKFPKAHRQIKGQKVQDRMKYIKIIKWKTSYLM